MPGFEHISIESPDYSNIQDLDSEIIPFYFQKIMVEFSYPLDNPAYFVLDSNTPITKRQFINWVSIMYHDIYETEQMTTTVLEGRNARFQDNRNATDGKYGIYGHHLSNLYLHGFYRWGNRNGLPMYRLQIDS